MNWTVRRVGVRVTEDREHCEHLTIGDESALATAEADSMGEDTLYCMCEACAVQYDEAEGEIEEVCHDCKQAVKMKDAIAWKWYDFHAGQGDEPLVICNCCRQKPTHISRIKRDREDYEEESSRWND